MNDDLTAGKTRAYKAFGTQRRTATGETPYEAGRRFFEKHPTARRCTVTAGWLDNGSFVIVVQYGVRLLSWKDITPKTLNRLPESIV